MDIYYENYECRPSNNALVVIESAIDDYKKPSRYLCGHYDGELDDQVQLPQLPTRQMTVIEEVTSSVWQYFKQSRGVSYSMICRFYIK